MPGAAQPVGHQGERAVAGQEARDEEHRLAAAVLDAVSAQDRIAQESGRFQPDSRLPPEGRPMAAGDGDPSAHRLTTITRVPAKSCVLASTKARSGYISRVRAVTIQDGRLVVEERPDPEPGKGEVLVRVRAAGLNGADMLQLTGGYPAPPGAPPDIPGLELAGEVVALGPDAGRFAEGDRVMAVVGGGGHAELALVHERGAMPVPDGTRVATGRRPPGGVHDRARRALHPGGAAPRRAAAGARRGRRGGHGRDPARPRGGCAGGGHGPPRGAARGGRAAGRHGDPARGLRGARPLPRGPRAGGRARTSRATFRRSPPADASR